MKKHPILLLLVLMLVVTLPSNIPIVKASPGYPVIEDITPSSDESGTNHVIDYPATVDPGDLLIAAFTCDDNEPVTFPNEGTDWTTIYNEDAGNSGPTLAIAWREAVGDEDGGTFTITTGTTEGTCTYVFRISGAEDPDTQAPEASVEASGNAVNPNSLSLTPTGGSKEYLWLSIEGNDDDDDTTGWPANMADNNQFAQVTSVTLGIATEEVETDTFDPAQFTIASSETWEAATIAIHPITIAGEEYDRPASQSISVAMDTSKLLEATRPASQGIGFVLGTSRMIEVSRSVSQAIGIVLDGEKIAEFLRSASQGISVSLTAVRLGEYFRDVSQTVGIELDGALGLIEVSRTATQSINIALDGALGLIEVSRSVSQAIGVSLQAVGTTVGEYLRNAALSISLTISAYRLGNNPWARVGWLSGWDNRVKITIDSGDIGAGLSNFPVLIYLSSSSGINGDDVTFVFEEVGANSLKIAVTLSDGITECYVEIEKWDIGYKEAWLWAKITSVSNITDTEIYLYYDNGHADNCAYIGLTNSAVAENVWDSDFLMVQHQAGDSSPIRDSTSSDTDMTEGGDPTYLQAGPIDGEIDYDGNDYHLSAANVFDAIVGAEKGTMSLWINTTTSVAASHVPLSIEGAYMMLFRTGEGGLLKTCWSGTHSDSARTTTQINTGAQFYVVSTYDGSNQSVYVNGNLEATDACNLYDITALNRATGLASHYTGSTSIDANIDDVRISKINRPPSWIVASYETGRDDLLDFGSEEVAPDRAMINLLGIFTAFLVIVVLFAARRR